MAGRDQKCRKVTCVLVLMRLTEWRLSERTQTPSSVILLNAELNLFHMSSSIKQDPTNKETFSKEKDTDMTAAGKRVSRRIKDKNGKPA